MTVRYLPCGDTGLTVQLSDVADLAINAQVHRLRNRIAGLELPGLVEAVPTYRSVTLHYNPLQTSQAELQSAIEPLLSDAGPQSQIETRLWRLPVCCDGEDLAPDLGFVAEQADTKPADIVEILAATTQVVYMIGFAPGQPYLGDLPARLALPRRENPVPNVPVGSVVTATGKTVVYSVPNPTGWYLIGRTPMRLFQAHAEVPVLLNPGDRVTFEPVSRAVFGDLCTRVDEGRYQLEPEILK